MSRSRSRLRFQGGAMLARFRRVGTGAVVGIVVGLIASHAWSQEPTPSGTKDQPPVPGVPPTLQSPGQPMASYPLTLFGLLGPSARRGPVMVIISFAYTA